MPTIYKNMGKGIRNNRMRPLVSGKRYLKTDIVSGAMMGTDNFSLKNVFKKLDDVGAKITGAIAPKFQAKLDAAKEEAKQDDGKVSFGEKLGIGFKNATLPMLGVAAGVTGLGVVANQINKNEAKADLNSDIAGASAPIPNIEPPKVAEIATTVSQPEPIVSTPVSSPKPTVVEQVKEAASKITPANIDKATKLLQTGQGLLTKDQETIRRNLTSPAMLPKTKASKEAERALTLPYVSKDEKPGVASASVPMDMNTYIIAGVVLSIIVILAIVLKK